MKRGLGISAMVCGLFLVAGVAFAQNDDFFVVIAGGGDWKLTGNAGTTPGTHFVGTTDNKALDFRVNNARALRLEPDVTSPNVIVGYSGNTVSAGVWGATISGGGVSGSNHLVSANYGTIGGGSNNEVSGAVATVGGGYGNEASASYTTVGGGYSNEASNYRATVAGGYDNEASGEYATVGGGSNNTVSIYGDYATVSGGQNNTANEEHATVSGGQNNMANQEHATVGGGASNTAGGDYATVSGGGANMATGFTATVGGGSNNNAHGDYAAVPGGRENSASSYSFAAGFRAKANRIGCFVWGDSTVADVTCDVVNRWVARASGGVYFYTNSDLTAGVYVSDGGSSWNSISHRATKEHFSFVDGRSVLERLATMPVQAYNLRSQDPSIRHIGPVAEDFYAAFGYGESERAINMEDANGVALAAIKGLYEMLREKEARIKELERGLARLEAIVARGLKANAMRLSESER